MVDSRLVIVHYWLRVSSQVGSSATVLKSRRFVEIALAMQAPPSLGVKMARSEQSRGIPTQLSLRQFRQFVLPHLTVGRRGPAPKLSLHTLFNYILKVLYLGCQWKELRLQKTPTVARRSTTPEFMAPF